MPTSRAALTIHLPLEDSTRANTITFVEHMIDMRSLVRKYDFGKPSPNTKLISRF